MYKRAIKLEIKASSEGVIEGYASRFGEIDDYGDIMVKGAFADSLQERKVSMLWQHDMGQPVGVWNELSEDDNGLYAKGKILDKVEKGREALALIEEGALDGLSIGFRIKPDGREYNEEGYRLIKSVDLFEISLVTFPALNSARIDAMKAAEMTERDMERLLMQDAGLSRSVARLLMSGGLDAVKAKQDAGEGGFCELVQFMREHNMQ